MLIGIPFVISKEQMIGIMVRWKFLRLKSVAAFFFASG